MMVFGSSRWPAVCALGVLGACRVNLPLDMRTAEPGDLVITEVMTNPLAVADHVGEWVEVHVPGDRDVDIDGMFLRSLDGSGGEIVGEDLEALIPAGGYAVIARRDEANFAIPEIAPLAYWGQDPGLDDEAERIEIVGTRGVLDQSPDLGPLASREGVAWQLDPTELDALRNDAAAVWCSAVTPMDNGDLGTPGAVNDGC